MNITVPMASHVTEKVKENNIVKFLMKIIFYSCDTKHIMSCQIYVNGLITVSDCSSK